VPIRIYAFAKELGIENKELLDLCGKAGITGKGSALASLSDDEVAKVKAQMSGGESAAAPAKPKPSSNAPIRSADAASARRKPITVGPLGRRKSAKADAPSEAPEAAPADESAKDSTPTPEVKTEPVVEEPVAEKAADKPAVNPKSSGKSAVSKPSSPKQSDAPERPASPRRESFSPLGGRGKIKVLPSKPKPSDKPREAAAEKTATPSKPSKPNKKEAPAVRMASVPQAKQPIAKAPEPETAAQKPDIRLPKDAIAKHKEGSSAPLEQFTETQNKKTKSKADKDKEKKGPLDRHRGRNKLDPDEARMMGKTRTERKRRQEGGVEGDSPLGRRRRPKPKRKKRGASTEERKKAVVLQLPCTVREFSLSAGIGVGQVLKFLMAEEIDATINSLINDDLVDLLVEHFEVKVEIREAESLEDKTIGLLDDQEDAEEDLEPRAPIVTFLGHVDHGKTSLLDYLIGIDVVSGEAGGITQHIRAYEVHKDDRKIAFVDTPGHEAFTEMRARGANVTDIAVLVVAADDGVMPQTAEAISHARAAGVPIVVAMNKIDLPGANPDKVYQDLAANDLLPSEWGGEIEVVKTSAITGEGMDELLETLLLVADLNEYKANPDRPAVGVCIEAEQEPGKGVITKIMVRKGTLRVGDVIVCGGAHGRVKAMYNTLNAKERLKEAGPSTPVNLTGLDIAPEAGDAFHVLDNIGKAREIAAARAEDRRTGALNVRGTVETSFDMFQKMLEEGSLGMTDEKFYLNLIVRADTRGSIEAIQQELGKFSHPEVGIKVLQASVGGVSVADVTLASASQAVIVSFGVIADEAARAMAETRGVEIRRYDIIYKVTDDIKLMLEGQLKPAQETVELGTAAVLRTFDISRVGTIAGCRVVRGTIERNCRVRVYRDNRIIGEYPLDTLRREKDDVKDVRQGMECGMKLSGFNDVKVDDLFEAYKIEEVARTLE